MRPQLQSKVSIGQDLALSTIYSYTPSPEFDSPAAVEALSARLADSERGFESEYITHVSDPIHRGYIASEMWVDSEEASAHFHSHDMNMVRNLFQKTLRGKLDDWRGSKQLRDSHVLSRYFGRKYGTTSLTSDEDPYYFATYSVMCDTPPDPNLLLDLVREQTGIARLYDDMMSGVIYDELALDLIAVAKVEESMSLASLLECDDPAILRALCFRHDYQTKRAASVQAQFALLDNPATPIDGLVAIATRNTSEEFQLRLIERDDFVGAWREVVYRMTAYPSFVQAMLDKELGWLSNARAA